MWQTISVILNIILAILSVYFYFVLKGLEVEKSLAVKKADLDKLRNNYSLNMVGTAGHYKKSFTSDLKEENEYIYKITCLDADIKKLEKILKKFYFIKWFIQ